MSNPFVRLKLVAEGKDGPYADIRRDECQEILDYIAELRKYN